MLGAVGLCVSVSESCLIRPLGWRTGGSPAPLPRLLSCPIGWDGVLSGSECVHECPLPLEGETSCVQSSKGVFVAESSLPDVKVLFPHGVEVKFAR